MNRRGVSAVAVTVFGVIAILLGLLAFSTLTLALIRGVGSGMEIAERRAGESKAIVKVYVELAQEFSGGTLLNKTYIVFENLYPGDVTIDHVAIVSKGGQRILDKAVSLTIRAGGSVKLRPSQIDPALQVYDQDFWKLKREVGYVEMHADVGGGTSFKSHPIYFVAGRIPEIIITTTTAAPTAITTVTTTATATVTSTTTPTRTITVTRTTTLTCTACQQWPIITSAVIVTVTQPMYVPVTHTVIDTATRRCTIRTYYTWTRVTVTTTVTTLVRDTVTCEECGACPRATQCGGNSPLSQTHHPLHLYLSAPLLAAWFIPRNLLRGSKTWGLILFVLLSSGSLTAFMATCPRDVSAEGATVTVTVTTGQPTTVTTTVGTTTTVTSIQTAPATTVTVTSTVTSTTEVTRVRCLGITITWTITTTPVIADTQKITTPCSDRRITVTVTEISTYMHTHLLVVDSHSITCLTTVR